MSTIGQGVIELSADGSKLKAGIEDAKRSIKSLGTATSDVSKSASQSIDRYVKRLETQAATLGKSTRETELYKLALRGANKDQLAAANSALRLAEAYEKGAVLGARIRTTLVAAGAAAATATIAAAVAFDNLIKKAGDFQDAAEKTGDSAENIASLAVAAGTTGTAFDQVVSASVKLTKGLTGVDDESKAAGAAIASLGLDLTTFKNLNSADQLEAVAKAINGFGESSKKTAIAVALFGKSGADLLPFLKELGAEGGRQVILTEKQIRLADDFADRQNKLRTQVGLYAQAIATDLIPAINDFNSTIASVSSGQSVAAQASSLLQASLGGLITIFQTIAVVGSDVVFVFKGVGRELGAIAAQVDALGIKATDVAGGFAGITAGLARSLAKGESSAARFTFISDAVKEDGERARTELDKFQKRILSIGSPENLAASRLGADPQELARRGRGASVRPSLSFDGADKKGKNTAASEAKAQLALEIEDIRRASEAIIATYANADKVIEAQRSANLLSDREYYDAKRALLNLNTSAQEDALTKELARLRAENLSGKDRIDNDRKILEVQAKLAKVRENSFTSLQVLQINETAYFEQVKKNYIEAEQAARSYLDTLRLQQDRETAGLGQGNVARNRNAGISQIEDKFAEQRLRLEQDKRNGAFKGREDDYQKELDLIRRSEAEALQIFTDGFDKRIEVQRNWQIGASEAFRNYYDEASNTAKQVEDLFTNAFRGLEDALVNFVKTGKLDFKSLADSIITDLIRIQVKKAVVGIFGGDNGIIGGGIGGGAGNGAGGGIGDFLGSLFGARAIGGPVSAGKSYLVGERGPEIFTPSVMGGVTSNSAAGGAVSVVVNVDASGSSAQGNNEQSNQLGALVGNAVRSVLLQEKRPGGLLAA